MYSLSKKRAEGEDEIGVYLGKDCKAGHGKCLFFVLKSPHREHTPFHPSHATHLCRDHGL